MSILSAILGGIGAGMETYGKNAYAAEQKEKDRRLEAELRKAEMRTAEKLREEFESNREKRKLEQDKTNASNVSNGAKNIDTERSAGLINQTVGPVPSEGEFADKKMTADDIATIRNNMKPEDAKKLYGIDPYSRAQRAEDSGVAAQELGLIGMSKDFRADAEQYRRQTSDENRYESSERRLNLQEKTQADNVAWQKSQAGIANRRADLSEQRAERTLNFMELRDTRADDEGKRRAAATAIKDLEEKSKEIKRGIDTGMLSPEALKIDQAELNALDTERARYRNLLGNMSGLPDVPDAQKPSQIDTLFPKRNDGKKEGSKDGGKPVVQRDPNIPQFSTFDKMTVASAAEIADAQRKVDDAKQAMDRSRNSQTINAYNQAATQLATIAKRGR